jgi:hypothetical protein
MRAKEKTMHIGRHALALQLPLLNRPRTSAPNEEDNTMFYAHEAFELVLQHRYRRHEEMFPESEILRLFADIEPGDPVDRNKPDIAALLKYPIRMPHTEVRLSFGAADCMNPQDILNHKVYGCLHEGIRNDIANNRMDIVVLSPADSPKSCFRNSTHTVSLSEMMGLMTRCQASDEYMIDKRKQPMHGARRRSLPDFLGLTMKRNRTTKEITGFIVGQAPAQYYDPESEENKKLFAKVAEGKWSYDRILRRNGRGFAIILPVGVLDMFLRSFVCYTLDEDEERTVHVDGKPLKATVKKLSLYNTWRQEHCVTDYVDLTDAAKVTREPSAPETPTAATDEDEEEAQTDSTVAVPDAAEGQSLNSDPAADLESAPDDDGFDSDEETPDSSENGTTDVHPDAEEPALVSAPN